MYFCNIVTFIILLITQIQYSLPKLVCNDGSVDIIHICLCHNLQRHILTHQLLLIEDEGDGGGVVDVSQSRDLLHCWKWEKFNLGIVHTNQPKASFPDLLYLISDGGRGGGEFCSLIYYFATKKIAASFLNKNIGATIHISWEIRCLPYARFFLNVVHTTILLFTMASTIVGPWSCGHPVER